VEKLNGPTKQPSIHARRFLASLWRTQLKGKRKEFKVLKEFPEIGSAIFRVKVRVITYGGKPFLDLREFTKTATFEGLTQKGIMLSEADLKQLDSVILPSTLRFLKNHAKRENKQLSMDI